MSCGSGETAILLLARLFLMLVLHLAVAGLSAGRLRLTPQSCFVQARLSQDCMRAIMKMTYCPHCRGMASARPCANYCTNVMKGCLANQADLNPEWRHLAGGGSAVGKPAFAQTALSCSLTHLPRVFKDTMMQVAERLRGPNGVEDTIKTLPNSISDAILTAMGNMETVKNKVRAHFITGCSRMTGEIKIFIIV